MGQFEVTQAQYQQITGQNPATSSGSQFVDPQKPIINVDSDDAVAFCQALSQRTGRNYVLPTGAQWEYACRACTTTPFHFGETITPDLVNYGSNDRDAANEPEGTYRWETTPVGSFPPNPWGLHDMHGNVWEQCANEYHWDYRGGCWMNFARDTSSASESIIPWGDNGFRVLLSSRIP
jgi:formylglycine-generating enzyme required for sulfatase activity